MVAELAFTPRLDWLWIAFLVATVTGALGWAAWRRVSGWPMRAVAAGVLLAALANPQLQVEEREPLSDVVFVIIDDSPSQGIGERPQQTAAAESALTEAFKAFSLQGDFEYRVVRAETHTSGEDGTRLLTALEAAAREVVPGRTAGAVLVTDGRVHDAGLLAGFPGPVHALVTGRAGEYDRYLVLRQAPNFGILREGVELAFVVEGTGEPPTGGAEPVEVEIRVDGRTAARVSTEVGAEETLRVPLPHAGANVVELRVAAAEGEVTARNNRAAVSVKGIRDRLRVLLISGSPHPANRVWRNLLKSDPSVDLVHFTTLRPPGKLRVAADQELSLIVFPVKRLFVDEIDGFDLIIFDRYRRQGVLPDSYLAGFARYVREGGALLLAGSNEFSGTTSVARSPMSEILPARPTGRLLRSAFVPALSRDGERHPLTAALSGSLDDAGSWYRQAEMEVKGGQTLMTGIGGRPLLAVDRVGEGRVGVLGSEHAWLWSRGHGGGGPHGELFRRVAHWLMKEPDLEEEALRLEVADGALAVTRRSLASGPGAVTVETPSGGSLRPELVETGPGVWRGVVEGAEEGYYRAVVGGLEALALVGAADSKEFGDATSSTEILAPLAEATGGTLRRLEGGVPELRRVRAGAAASGSRWIGFPRREAYAVRGLRIRGLLPAWLALLAVGLALCLAWWVESGRFRDYWRARNTRRTDSMSSAET